eukprot:TRINITY_DN47901_c0_g1_i1.p1 TRINITY_DN47901_c0_g1~~TRINITY_DN47901_c0_g1_i1.p1  ORF type:complete len:379 (+),score=61.87 TRINITY_DN47901_c0_g1_i1:211-1347(+)
MEAGTGALGGPAAGSYGGTGIFYQTPRPDPPKRVRFGEPLKFLPVIFVVVTIAVLYTIYVFFHCIPLLQMSVAPKHVDRDARQRAVWELLVFHCLTVMLLICYVRSILIHPGTIPDDDPHWEYLPQEGAGASESAPLSLQETKKSGDRRHCKWCGKYKPDRCHHCRVCKTCILKMDHHCPWIYNCVGFANYKFFFLLLFYSMLDTHLIFWTMLESVMRVLVEESDFLTMFLLFFGAIIALFYSILITMFLSFHIWLSMKALTTIEYCEKRYVPKKDGGKRSCEASVYDLGFYGNCKAVLGSNPLLWLVPINQPVGDGLNFVSDDSRLTADLETGRGLRRKTHQKTQRIPQQYAEHSAYAGYYDNMIDGDFGASYSFDY